MNLRTVPTLAALALAGSLLAYQAAARRPAPPQPPTVAVVRILNLFEGLEQRADAKAELERMEDQQRAEKTARETALNKKKDAIKDIDDPADRAAAEDAVALEQYAYEFWLQESMTELEVEKALRLRGLYKDIRKAIRDLAENEGYDLVLMDDSIEELVFDREMRTSPQVQVLQQITSTNVLYVVPRIDVTDQLTVRMNNAFKAGGP